MPSLNNWASVCVAAVAMMYGQMYFSMPLFIVGSNFQSTYENFQWNNKRNARQLDATLTPFDAQELHAFTHKLTTAHFHVVEAWRVVQLNIAKVLRKSRLESAGTSEDAVAQTARLAKIKEASDKLLHVHSDACDLLQHFVPHKKKERAACGDARQDGVFAHIYVRARRAMVKNRNFDSAGSRDAISMATTLRGRLWLALEAPDSSQAAGVINKVMVGFALLSVLLICCESLPELSSTGVETNACRHVVKEHCQATGFEGTQWEKPDPGCFLLDATGAADYAQQIDFMCADPSDAPNCYAGGANFGSLGASAPSCESVFGPSGTSFICFRQQCNKVDTVVDMGPYWIYFEWMFGVVFTFELVLRFAASHEPARLVRDVYIVFDILSVVPFFVEVRATTALEGAVVATHASHCALQVMQYLVQGVEPSYAMVATSPSFLSVIRVMKMTRILKLTRVRALLSCMPSLGSHIPHGVVASTSKGRRC